MEWAHVLLDCGSVVRITSCGCVDRTVRVYHGLPAFHRLLAFALVWLYVSSWMMMGKLRLGTIFIQDELNTPFRICLLCLLECGKF